jgi:hypothetical protein
MKVLAGEHFNDSGNSTDKMFIGMYVLMVLQKSQQLSFLTGLANRFQTLIVQISTNLRLSMTILP